MMLHRLCVSRARHSRAATPLQQDIAAQWRRNSTRLPLTVWLALAVVAHVARPTPIEVGYDEADSPFRVSSVSIPG